MSAPDLERVVTAVVRALERLEIPYHLTGGLASSYHGEPRFTQDVDFVVLVGEEDARRLAEELSAEFLVDPDRASAAARSGGLFQALHRELLIKADLHVGEDIPGELGRSRVTRLFPGVDVRTVSKEDAIFSKLVWARDGSEKSRDVLGMLLDPTPFDLGLVRRLASELGCLDVLEAVERESADL
jgi:hypothetical protein